MSDSLLNKQKGSITIDKLAAKEYIRIALDVKERFDNRYKLLLHFNWNPVHFINSKETIRQRYNYWLPYIRLAEPFDEEVAYLFMVLQMLLVENESWRQYLTEEIMKCDDLHAQCVLTADVQFELLMKAVKALEGDYFNPISCNIPAKILATVVFAVPGLPVNSIFNTIGSTS